MIDINSFEFPYENGDDGDLFSGRLAGPIYPDSTEEHIEAVKIGLMSEINNILDGACALCPAVNKFKSETLDLCLKRASLLGKQELLLRGKSLVVVTTRLFTDKYGQENYADIRTEVYIDEPGLVDKIIEQLDDLEAKIAKNIRTIQHITESCAGPKDFVQTSSASNTELHLRECDSRRMREIAATMIADGSSPEGLSHFLIGIVGITLDPNERAE